VEKLARLVGRQLDERHVVRHTGVVDEHGELLACAHVGDRLHPGVRCKVSDEGTYADVWKRSDELLEPLTPSAYDHEVVPFGA